MNITLDDIVNVCLGIFMLTVALAVIVFIIVMIMQAVC